MDFFARQDASRRSTRWLILLFGLAFLTVALATAAVVALTLSTFNNQSILSTQIGNDALSMPAMQPLALAAGTTLLLMLIASLYRSATLSRGGGQVAKMLGGTRIHGDETDPLQRRLINVVEEMAIASGLPVPEIYVLEREAGINAFAAGLGHEDAAVAVTRGCLEQLDRGELRGVIAHEFSHILNGDMRLNLRLMGYAYGILILTLVGRWLLRGTRSFRSSRNRGGGIAMIGLALVVIGSIGVLLSRLIKAAVSRQREVLADASAVQFTREPLALAGALKKIGGFTPHLNATETEEVSHMLFGRGASSFRGWFATHPPLPERIRALDPSFVDEQWPVPRDSGRIDRTAASPQVSSLTDTPALDQVTVAAAGSIRADATGELLHRAIPESLLTSAHGIEDSVLLIVAIALAADPDSTRVQSKLLRARLGQRRTDRSFALSRELALLDRRLWLPLVEVSVPALKRRPAAQIEFVLDLIERLVEADSRHSLFEHVLTRLLTAYLAPAKLQPDRSDMPIPVAWRTAVAMVAINGHAELSHVKAALAAGLTDLAQAERTDSAIESAIAGVDGPQFDLALAVLARAPLRVRRGVLVAIERTIRHDGAIQIEEAELFRAIGASIGCPIPPASALS